MLELQARPVKLGVALIDQRQRIRKPALMHRLHDLVGPLRAIPSYQMPGRFERRKMLLGIATIPTWATLDCRYKSACLVVAHLLHTNMDRLGKIFCA